MKKQLSIIAMAALSLGAHAQYSVKGIVPDLADGTTIYLTQHGTPTDSAVVSNGTFLIKSDKHKEIGYDEIHSSDFKWGTMFWMGNDQVTIDVPNNKLSGAPEEDLYQAYRECLNPVWDEEEKIVNEQQADFQKNGYKNWDYYSNLLKVEMRAKEDSIFLQFCDQHPRAYICLNHIYNRRVMDKYPYKKYIAMAEHLDTTAFSGRLWNTFREVCQQDKSLEPGNPFPVKMEGTDVYGEQWSLDNYKGKYTLIVISNANYDEHKSFHPEYTALYDKYHAKGYEEYDFLLCSDRKDLLKQGASCPPKWNIVSDFKAWNTSLLRTIGLDHISQYYFLSPDGTILCHADNFPEAKAAVIKAMEGK